MNTAVGGDAYSPDVIYVADDRISGRHHEVCVSSDQKENLSLIILEGLLASIALG